ncbi:MAG TPA: divergent PAP2 family protein [Magnetospirillaceae bacterium]|nr:divergent PAP2 family protein [Magnetospirillaceae bacterium]
MPIESVPATDLDNAARVEESRQMQGTPTSAGVLQELLRNPVFLSSAVSLFTAQFIKAVIGISRNRVRSLRGVAETILWRTGGMPSSHCALVVALTSALALTEGVKTNVFTLSLFFSLIVVRDALGVRRAAGMQARAINALQKELETRLGISARPIKEVHGHTFPQVLVGCLLGFFFSLAFCTL